MDELKRGFQRESRVLRSGEGGRRGMLGGEPTSWVLSWKSNSTDTGSSEASSRTGWGWGDKVRGRSSLGSVVVVRVRGFLESKQFAPASLQLTAATDASGATALISS